MMYKQNYYRPGRVYMFPIGSTEVDPGELTWILQVVLKLTLENLQSGEFTGH